MEWVKLVIAIISGIAACVPLVISLIKTIKEAAKSKNWTAVFQVVSRLVKEAETNIDNGADRRTWVINSVKAMEKSLNTEINEETIGEMIDSIVDVSKIVNKK